MSEHSGAMSVAYTSHMLSSPPGSKSGWRKFARQNTWYKKVYRRTLTDPVELLHQFRHLSKIIFKKDRYACQSCFRTRYKLSLLQRYLTCHHISPREEGGSLLEDNLITLCNRCHDAVEERKLYTRGEIIGLLSDAHRHYRVNQALGGDWHKWVYGGYRRPAS